MAIRCELKDFELIVDDNWNKSNILYIFFDQEFSFFLVIIDPQQMLL
jgi:hypothetical protein